ncbi:MAG: serine/threonine-protein phosphatase [Fimbriimonadaceae bacterium]|nr:serine/threonine-protein phosphatase [Fimbriimonadaceae bacterium]
MDEITAPFAPVELSPPPPLTVRWRYQIAGRTDMGRVRENNEDKFEFYIPGDEATLARRGAAFIVCDGMGGHEAGQIASELAAKTWVDVYYQHPSDDPAAAAEAATHAANRFVFDRQSAIPKFRGMGTTLTGLVVVQNQAVIAQIGDSRCYRLRGGKLEAMTTDQTWVEEAVASGMDRAEAESHQYRHVILQAIGTMADVKPVMRTEEVEDGDIFFLCSDGVTNHVVDEAIERTLADFGPAQAAWSLVNQALIGGGSDNATCIVVRFDREI